MTIAKGKQEYIEGTDPCTGVGLSWSVDELGAAMADEVVGLIFDEEGQATVEDILADIADTEFAESNLRQTLAVVGNVKDWRVGEAIAEAYLVEHRACEFPWPDSRDKRRMNSSLPGPDLVGLRKDSHGYVFAFGEVKSSSEARYPPRVMSGSSGLSEQLENLRDSEQTRGQLMMYLGLRARATAWEQRFKTASTRYLRNKSDVHLYGVLVRDVVPERGDLYRSVKQLASGCPDDTKIEQIALYLPENHLGGIGEKAVNLRTGGSA